eukprot:469180_1
MALWEWDPNTSHNHILINNKTIKNHTKGKHCAFSAESISFGTRKWRIKMMNKVDYICIGLIHNPESKYANKIFCANAENGRFCQGGGKNKYSCVAYYMSVKYLDMNDVVTVDLDCDAGSLAVYIVRTAWCDTNHTIEVTNKNVNYHLAVCLFNKDDSVQFIEEKKVVVRVSGQNFREINANYSNVYTYPNNNNILNDILKIKLFLYGYCRLNSRLVPSDIIQLIYVYYSIFDEWDQPLAHSAQRLHFLMNNMRVRRTRDKTYHKYKIYAFGTKIISINNNNSLHKWKLTLNARHKSGGHVCCGIGIMNVNDIKNMSYLNWSNFRETFFNWDSKIMPIHDIYLKSGHGIYTKYTKQINKFIGIECVLCVGLHPPVPKRRNSDNLVETHFGHCLNDHEFIQNATTNDLTTFNTCFGGRDQVQMVVNCKKQLLNISVKSKSETSFKWNFEKDLKNIEGKYKLAVWLRNPKQGITITDVASIL